MSETGTVAVAIVCMDRRLHEPKADTYQQIQAILGVDHVYMLTGAGPEGKLLKRQGGHDDFIADTALIIEAKGATTVAICGHYDCAGHPVEDHQHDADVMEAANLLREALPDFKGAIVPLIARKAEPDHASTWIIVRA